MKKRGSFVFRTLCACSLGVLLSGTVSALAGESATAEGKPKSAGDGKSYEVRGRITGLEDGTIFRLSLLGNQELHKIGQDTLRGGVFRFSGQIDSVQRMWLECDKFITGALLFWSGPGIATEITGEGALRSAWRAENTLPEQLLTNRFADTTREECIEQDRIIHEWILSGKKKNPHNDSLWTRYHSLRPIVDSKEVELLCSLPVSPVWMNKLRSHAYAVYSDPNHPHRDRIVALYEQLDDRWKQSADGRLIAAKLYPPKAAVAGDEAPDADLKDSTDKVCRLIDFREPGKYMLLDFWASFCGPCRMAAPEMKKVSEQYCDRLVIVGINLDSNREIWLKAVRVDGISWTTLNDPGSFEGLAARYGVKGIPHYVLISPEGKVVTSWSGYGPGLFEERVVKVLGEAEKPSAQAK